MMSDEVTKCYFFDAEKKNPWKIARKHRKHQDASERNSCQQIISLFHSIIYLENIFIFTFSSFVFIYIFIYISGYYLHCAEVCYSWILFKRSETCFLL